MTTNSVENFGLKLLFDILASQGCVHLVKDYHKVVYFAKNAASLLLLCKTTTTLLQVVAIQKFPYGL